MIINHTDDYCVVITDDAANTAYYTITFNKLRNSSFALSVTCHTVTAPMLHVAYAADGVPAVDIRNGTVVCSGRIDETFYRHEEADA